MNRFTTAIQDHARTKLEKPALVFEGQSWTYAQLDAATDAVAAQLRNQGIRPRDIVPVLLPRGQ